jgi:parallel beta-helix repeat protein
MNNDALAEAVRLLMAERRLPHDHIRTDAADDPLPPRRAGETSVVVAALDASTFSLGRADYFCNGVEDDKIIQAALDQLPASGGRIRLTEGTFKFGATGLTLPPSNVTLEGLGMGVTILLATVVISSMIKNDDNVGQSRYQRIQDLTIDGDDKAVYGILAPQACQVFMEVDRVGIFDCTSNGVNLARPAGYWRFRRCVFSGNNGNGVSGREAGQEYMDCTFSNNTGAGVGIQQDGNGHIMGCQFSNNGGAGIASGNAISQGFGNFIITNNIFSGNGGCAVHIQDGDDNLIANNIFESNAGGSVCIGAGAFGTSNDNFVVGNIQDGGGTFISVSAGSSAHQTSNVINGVLEAGPVFESKFTTTTSTFHQGGVLTTGVGTFKLPWTTSGTITGVRAAAGIAPVGADIIVDVNKNGTSIFSALNQPRVPAGSTVGAEATTIASPNLVSGDYLTVDIDQIGSSTPGTDLVVVVEWRVAV